MKSLNKRLSLNRKNERKVTYALMVFPTTLLYSVFFILPIIMGIYYSLTNWDGITPKFSFIGLSNYTDILSDSRFIKALFFNLKYSVMLIICIVSISLLLALFLNSKIKGKTFFRSLYFFPAILSMITVGLIFNEIFYRTIPQLGQFLSLNILKNNILANPDTAIFGILITHVWQGVAIPTILLLGGLQSIPNDLLEASTLDGAGVWQKFRYITLPFVLPVLSVVLVLVLKDGISVFDYIVALTQGGPAGSTESMALLVYNYGFGEMKFSYGIAGAMLMSILILIISFVQISFTNKKRVY